MAYTKIHAIKATVDKAIEYICNPDKTDEQIYVSSYACAPETAAIDFKYTLDHCRENSPNKAYHLIQAFAPGEVSYEEAHRIGKELADKVLEGKYSYVLTTHIDKGHCILLTDYGYQLVCLVCSIIISTIIHNVVQRICSHRHLLTYPLTPLLS